MRRVRILYGITLLALAGGLASLLPLAHVVDTGHEPHAFAPLTAVLLLTSTAGALCVAAGVRRDARRLADALRDRAAGESLDPVDPSTSTLPRLVEAGNAVLALARQSLDDAAMRVKQFEIQLKVATMERQHAEAIIKSISDAVLVTSTFDEVVLANDSAAKAFDFVLDTGRDATGGGANRTPIERLLRDEKLIALIREMRQSKTATGRRVVEHQARTSEGDRTFKLTLSGVADGAGAPAGVVAVLHDMTREKEVAEMKNDFVSNVSHELRTPLASIKAYVEMLIDGEADDERTKTEFYEIIQGEANRLGRLIDNILNISRIESGLVKINKVPQSISVIVKEAIDVIAPQARLKHIELVEDLCPVFYQTFGDKDMLYQAVLNVLSNSVKYTPDGGRVTVRTSVDEGRKKAFVRIIDTGVGIPAKDLPHVFDKFYRVEANSRMAKGTGLGLSLVKHIVETVHHGEAFVTSEVGKGTTFGFELDVHE